MNLIHCGIILLIGIAASGLRVSAATPVQILADRLANITNDYVFVVADGGFGFEPGSREALATALQSWQERVWH